MRFRFLLVSLSLLTGAVLAGCDQVAELTGLDMFDVNLGSAAALPVVPDGAMSVGAPTAIDDRLPDVFDVSDIRIPQDAVAYDAAGVPGGERGSVCTVELYVMIDRVPAVHSTIAVDEGASRPVRSVTSRFAARYDRAAICDGLEACPVVGADLTQAEIRSRVNAAVDRRAFDLAVVAINDGPCAGLMTVERLHFALDFALDF